MQIKTLKNNFVGIRVKKITREKATLQILNEGFEFELPLSLLPSDIEAGEKLGLKILDAISETENHNIFARKLLEEIIN